MVAFFEGTQKASISRYDILARAPSRKDNLISRRSRKEWVVAAAGSKGFPQGLKP
jgi:hypothetical protein